MSFRLGGGPVEGIGPTALRSLSHRQHGELHLLPQVLCDFYMCTVHGYPHILFKYVYTCWSYL